MSTVVENLENLVALKIRASPETVFAYEMAGTLETIVWYQDDTLFCLRNENQE